MLDLIISPLNSIVSVPFKNINFSPCKAMNGLPNYKIEVELGELSLLVLSTKKIVGKTKKVT